MLVVERRRTLTEAVERAGVISTDDLVDRLGVSAETVRRDLAVLEGEGRLIRVRGGAASSARRSGEEPSFVERTTLEQESKQRLARAAAALLTDGQTIAIDVGTTALEVARAIPTDFRGTVATSSLLVAAELASRPRTEVFVSGGHVRAGDLACSNQHAQDFFRNFYPDIALLSSGGVDSVAGLTDFHYDEVDLRRTLIENCDRSYVVAAASKIDNVAPYKVCDLDRLAGLITDAEPSPELTQAITAAGGTLHRV